METKLRYSTFANYFEEALPIGNGSIGAMVYGGYDKEKLSLNHDTLWSGKPRRYSKPNAKEAYKTAQALVKEGKIQEATTLLQTEFTSNYGQSYMPLGNLHIECEGIGDASDCRRELDMARGVASVSYERDGVRFEREYFVSHPDKCVVVRIKSSKPASYVFSADTQLKGTVYTEKNRLILCGECPSFSPPHYAMEISPTAYDGDGIKFALIGTAVTDGEVTSKDSTIAVSCATEIMLTLCIETSFIDFDTLPTKEFLSPCKALAERVSKTPYATLLSRHVKDHSALFSRVELNLGFPSPDANTDERIRSEDKDSDLGMVELLYNFGRYLVIASSRDGSQATNLQGIWNEDFYPAWCSNYTVNINTEMNYWPVLSGNLAGLDTPVIELLKKISVTGVDSARDFYGAKGYCAHHNIDLWGLSTPVGAQREGCVRWAFWNMSSGWLCRHAFEHYEYTCDTDFLRDTAYPLMKGAAEFYLDILIKDGDNYIISPSTSPENAYYTDTGIKASISRYTTMTQGILIDLFTNVLKAAKILGIKDAFTEEIREKLPLLNTYAIGSDGELLEFDREYREEDIHHRHVSHLYGLYPGESITTESTPKFAEACKRTLIRRGDISTGWAMGWRVCLWSKLKDGDHALQLVKNQLKFVEPTSKENMHKGGTFPNLLCAHPPFQIDGNFGVCAGIALMLLQCEDGKIRILPALPTSFKNGSVKGLKAKGDITVDIEWENNRLKTYSLTSATKQTVTVSTPNGEEIIDLSAGIKTTVK